MESLWDGMVRYEAGPASDFFKLLQEMTKENPWIEGLMPGCEG